MYGRVLHLTDSRITAYQICKQKISIIAIFEGEQGRLEFIEYLSVDNITPIYLFVDTIQEDLRMVNLPHVLGRDHVDLLNHRMKQMFEQDTRVHATVQGREADGRRDDQILFLALGKNHILQPWLELIHFHKVPLKGIYSSALLTELIVSLLPSAENTLLVSHLSQINNHFSNGLRQSFFTGNKLRFSRLVPINLNNVNDYGLMLHQQISRLQDYLTSSRLLKNIKSLSVVVIGPAGCLTALSEFLAKSPLKTDNVHLIDIHSLAIHMGIHHAPESIALQELIAWQLVRYGAKNHYALSSDMRYEFHRHLRKVIHATAALSFIGAMVFSGLSLSHSQSIREEGYRLLNRKIRSQETVNIIRKNMPSLPKGLKIEHIRNIVDAGKQIKSLQMVPEASLIPLSNIISKYDDISLEQLSWQMEAKTLEQGFWIEKLNLRGYIKLQGLFSRTVGRFNHFLHALNSKNENWHIKTIQIPYANTKALANDGHEQESDKFIIEIEIHHPYTP